MMTKHTFSSAAMGGMGKVEVSAQNPTVTIGEKKVVVATGGSGGHIFPGLLVGNELKKRGFGVYFVGTLGHWQEIIASRGYPVHTVKARGLSTENAKSLLVSSASMVKSIIDSFFYLKKCRPDAVIGFGGYGAFPVVAAAFLLNIPTVIHEQNVRPGKANALLARWATKVALSFEESRPFFRRKNVVLTGCPSRQKSKVWSKGELLPAFGLKKDLRTILIFGGSQGSQRINDLFLSTAKRMKDKINFQVLHLAGSEEEQQRLAQAYAQTGLPAYVCAFSYEMEKIYQLADLAISRAGAVTVTELAAFGLPSILIPYPHAQAHQKDNAQVLVTAGLAVLMEEKEASPERLENEVVRMLKQEFPGTTKEKKTIWFPDAAERVAEETTALIRR